MRELTPPEPERLQARSHAGCGSPHDSDGFAAHGVAVNIYFAGDGAHFEVSRRALESHHLRASFRLLTLARLIDDRS